MTLGAVARTGDKIGAAIPLCGLGGIRFELLAVEEKKFPNAQRAPDVERKRYIVISNSFL